MTVEYAEDTNRANTRPYVLQRFPKTDMELWLFVKATWGIEIPYRAVCPGHVSPFQAFSDAYFARHPVTIWKGSRGFGGKTFTLSVLGMTEMVALGCKISILGGSGAQSQNVYRSMQSMWEYEHSPKYLLEHETQYNTFLKNGAYARTLTASQKSVRGLHPQRLRMDEIDEMELEILTAAQGQPMRSRLLPEVETQTVMSSTHQYPNGTMSKVLAIGRERGWPVYNWSLAQGTQVTTKRGLVNIEDVQLDDSMLTRTGYQKVQHVSLMGWKETISIVLTNGRTLRLTPEHLVATPNGWVRADSLSFGSPVTAIKHSHALPTVPPLVAGSHVRVFRGVLMPPDAVSDCELSHDEGSAEHVVSLSTGAHVARANTDSVSTQMVERKARVSVSVDAPSKSMSELFLPRIVSSDFSIPGRTGLSCPLPASRLDFDNSTSYVGSIKRDSSSSSVASVGARFASTSFTPFANCADVTVNTEVVHVASIHNGAIAPVWDIGVHGQHEFVAEGVVVHNCYKETSAQPGGWLTQSEVDRKRSEISTFMWETEYDLQEPSFDGRAIATEAVEAMFDPSSHHVPGTEGKRYQFVKYSPDRDYITGIDWAKDRDWTIIWTFDATVEPWVTVSWQRLGRVAWPAIISRANRQIEMYPGKMIHDSTGLGGVIKDMILLPDGMTKRSVTDQIMAGRKRSDMISDYVAAIEKGQIRSPRIEWAYNEHKFATNDDLFGNGHLPDTIAAGALAWSLRKKTFAKSAPIIDGALYRAESPWRI